MSFKTIAIRVGLFLLNVAVTSILRAFMSSNAVNEFKAIVALIDNTDMSSSSKLRRVRELIKKAGQDLESDIREDLPDMVRNVAIEAIAAKLNMDKLLEKATQ